MERATALLDRGETPWTKTTGLVVLGYVSKIDGSVQPYGLVVPDSWQPKGPFRHRLDIWFHGRGELLSEVNFLDDHRKNPGEFTPEDTFVLHPYGRYCNAAKLAGEVDAFEALADVKTRYKIDEDRISVRGFSMGGASTWHLAVHYPDLWFAANPGAGFSETPRFLDVFQKEKLEPTWYEKKLWQMYDCTDWARNLVGCPTVAYSGELDSQKQAADVMAQALRAQNLELTHIVGPGTKHNYQPASKREVEARMKSLAEVGRGPFDSTVDFTTFTLRYNQASWVTIDALEEHWKPAQIVATALMSEDSVMTIWTENVRAFTIDIPPGHFEQLFPGVRKFLFTSQRPTAFNPPGDLDMVLEGTLATTDRSLRCEFHRDESGWKIGPAPKDGLRKKHGLQGPIDDAFLDRFTFVRPTGTSKNEKVAAWVKSESDRAVKRWRTQMRGEAIVRDDTAVTDADIASSNLVLWGDPQSNAILKKIADKLPIQWDGDKVTVGETTYSAADHVPILIFPNPLNPEKYVVLNSGFTYREYDDLNNARQVPKLPDWAVVDVRTPPNSRYPGKVVAADFFDEAWKLKGK